MRNRNHYPDEWFDVIRPDILKRDNYKCTKCGLRHKSTGYYDKRKVFVVVDEFTEKWARVHGFKIQKISLQIMHIDQNKGNNDYKNLASGCPKCHLNFDREFNKVKRLMSKANRAQKP